MSVSEQIPSLGKVKSKRKIFNYLTVNFEQNLKMKETLGDELAAIRLQQYSNNLRRRYWQMTVEGIDIQCYEIYQL